MSNTVSLSNLMALKNVTDTILADPNTHMTLKEELGEAWGYAVGYFNDDAKAANFFLTSNKGLDGETPLQYCVASEEKKGAMVKTLFRGISDLHF